jgi:TolB-like protein
MEYLSNPEGGMGKTEGKKGMGLILLLLLFLSLASSLPAQGPLRVAILPFQIHSAENLAYLKEGIYDIISSRLTASGEIHVIGKSRIENVLIEMRPARITEEVAREAGTRLKADYVVMGSITKIGDFISLDARLIDTKGGKPPSGAFAQTRGLDQLMAKVDEFARDIWGKVLGKPTVTAEAPEGKAETPYIVRPKKSPVPQSQAEVGYQRSQKFPFEIRGMDIADVNGDGKNEIVVVGPHTVRVYEYKKEKLRLLKTLKGRPHQVFLALDVADLNGNGAAEIVVSGIRDVVNVREGDLNSFILEFEENRFKMVGDKKPWYLAVLDLPRKGPTLVGQRMGPVDNFFGPIYQFSWEGKAFRRGDKLPVPRGSRLFGLVIADVTGDGNAEVIRFDQADHLRVLSMDGKEVLYKTPSQFGGSGTYFDRPTLPTPTSADQVGKRVYIPGRILVHDLDGDGKVEVIVNKNHFAIGRMFERVRLYDKGEVYDLVWDGVMLAENWRTKEIPGYIADYQVEDYDNDGERELVVAMVPQTDLLQQAKSSHLLFFELF